MPIPHHQRIALLAATCLTAGALAAPQAQAQTLARYSFEGNTLTSSDKHDTSAASDIEPGAGIVVKDGDKQLSPAFHTSGSGNVTYVARCDKTANDPKTALADGDYLSFTLTPNDGQTVNLAQLSFKVTVLTAGVTLNHAVYTSVNGFTEGNEVAAGSNLTKTTAFTTHRVDLGARSEFQNLTEPVEVRIYLWDSSSSIHNGYRFDDITLDGAVK